MEEFMFPCLNKQLFGMACPGCGAQRALVLVFQAEFSAAFKMYPAIYSLIFLAAFLVTNLFIKFRTDYYIKIGLIVLNAIIIVISYLYKMNLFFN